MDPKPDPKPAVPAAQAPAPAAPKPAPPPKKERPKPVFNDKDGLLLPRQTRVWPTEVWGDPWSLPRYRNAAAMLVAILAALLGGAIAVGELSRFADPIQNLIARLCAQYGLPVWAPSGVWILLKVLVVAHVVLAAPIFLVWWERKISAHIQSRLGPMTVGGFHGWLQTIADGVKLVLKENITPAHADTWVHRLAPAVVCAPAILAFAPVSFGDQLCAAGIDVGLLYVFAVGGVSVVGIMMAGWGSANKYSLLGGLRSAAQLVSYELPRAFSVVPVLMFAESLDIAKIAASQSEYWFDLIPKWYLFYFPVGPLAFVIFLIASVAETNRTPFDIPEAESELVAGFHTEYSGMKFSLFFLAEYAYMLLACLLMSALFLGGGAPPMPFLGFIPSWAWFLAKTMTLVFCFLWFRWTFPRFRVDRLMDFNWKFLLPWSFANIAAAGALLRVVG